jgi:phage regulator Rha-like protein
MMKRYDFIEKTLYLIRKLLEEYLPKEATLDEMIEKRNKLLQKFIK